MPGIAGIISANLTGERQNDVSRMLEAMRHESHYVVRQHTCSELGVSVGWTGHRGAFDDCMPVVSRAGDVVLLFQGEVFQDGARLGRSHTSTDRGPAASAAELLELYEQLGDDFYSALNGWFSGVLIDRRKHSATLFNDRYGMGRVYLHEGAGEFIFASEAKSLLRIRTELRQLDSASVAEHLRYNCTLGSNTLFRAVTLLPRASRWTFQCDSRPTRKATYFDFGEWEKQSPIDSKEFPVQFAEVVSRVVPRYATNCGEVAFSLTAGLDTRAILAALGDLNAGIPCYTFGGPWRELYDVRTARTLTELHGQRFQVITADNRFLDRFGEYATRAVHVSDGMHDAFGAHDIFFNELAREVAPVRLTGKFGSEVVRVRNLVPSFSHAPGFLGPEMARLVEALPSYRERSRGIHPLTRVVTQEIPCHEYGRVAAEQSQLVQRTPYMDNSLVQLMYRAPAEVRDQGNLQEDYVRHRSPALAGVPTNLGRFVPGGRFGTMLRYRLLWALFKVEYIYLYATPHWLTRLDRSLEGMHLERILAGRQKWEGYRIWIKTHFAQFIHDTLGNAQCSYGDYMNRKNVLEMLERHTKGTHNYLNEINKALTLELIYSTVLRQD